MLKKGSLYSLEVEAEACIHRMAITFSSAGILCSKLRSRMTDAVLDSGQYAVLAHIG